MEKVIFGIKKKGKAKKSYNKNAKIPKAYRGQGRVQLIFITKNTKT